MTESRETQRRKAFHDQARPVANPPPPPAVPLTALCLIRGCLCLRDGANLCPGHQDPDLPKELRCHLS